MRLGAEPFRPLLVKSGCERRVGARVRPSAMVSQDQYLDEYRQRARECLRLAEGSRDDKKKAWRELALCWRLSDYGQEFPRGSKAA